MTHRLKTYPPETLHAFVDGELSAAQKAALLRDMANNPELAGEVAELTMLKATLHETCAEVPCPSLDLDKLFAEAEAKASAPTRGHVARLLRALRNGRMLRAFRGFGAGVLVAILSGVLVAGWLRAPISESDRFTALAISLHHQWLRHPGTNSADVGQAQLAAFRMQVPNIYVPDLSASKLRIAKVREFGKGGVHVGYVGTRSCHLSLFIRPGARFEAQPLTEKTIGDSRVFTWRANRLDYVLLAVGMDPNRLRLIAQDVSEATRLMQPFDQKTQMVLRLNRQKSQACVG